MKDTEEAAQRSAEELSGLPAVKTRRLGYPAVGSTETGRFQFHLLRQWRILGLLSAANSLQKNKQ